MKKCPQCRFELANADLTQGKCPECGASLAGVLTPTPADDAGNMATIGEVAENSFGDESDSDRADSPTVGASDTRQEREEVRRTIEQEDERRTADEEQRAESREQRSGERAPAKDDASKTLADVNRTIGDIEVDPSKTIEGQTVAGDSSDADVGKTVSEDPARTIDESLLSKDDTSKTVDNVNQTVELPSEGQRDTGQTVQDVNLDSDAGKTISESPIGGQTVEINEGEQLVGGQTVQDNNLEVDPGKTISDVHVGGQTIEIGEGDPPVGGQTIEMGSESDSTDPSKKTVPDAQINKTMEVPDGVNGSGTVNDVNVNQTVDISGELPTKPGTVTDRNASPTLDSTEVIANVAQHINKTWAGSFDDGDTPRTSLKTQVMDDPTGTKSDLVIQPRLFGNTDEPRSRSSVDYNLLEMLGEGGMGMVYAARQASIDRTVAIKMLKPRTAQDEVQRCKFLAEAVVTGDLEHPNIVPIYDLGRNAEGALFYAMKRVQGTPWDQIISKKSLSENIEILMKVADAIGFSHSRGIIHRDLKPENVMLGDFGEVLVMDWGLAIPTDNRLIAGMQSSTSMGGTPAYMAPEMATGPFNKIGPHSDVYLLGAILFEIVTGKPPHTGKDVMKCLFAAAKNQIQKVEDPNELVEIALKAMSTDPQERHRSVTAFQDAIRQYLSHSESILLSDHAEKDLATASRTNDYQDFARALFGFQQAVELWDGNEPAKDGLSLAQVAYATSARDKGDFDLGASLLDAEKPNQVELLSEIREAKREVEARQHRLKTTKRALMALAALFVIGVTVALVAVLSAQAETKRQRVIAEEQRDKAVIEEEKAKLAEAEALKQKGIAETNLVKAQEEEAKAKLAAEEEKKAKIAALAAEQKAKDEETKAKLAAEEEKKAKIAALAAEKKAKEEEAKALLAAEEEKKAKITALAAEKKAKEEEAKAKLAAEEEKKAKIAALAAEKKAKEEEAKAKLAAELEMKAKIAAIASEKKAKEEEAKAKAAELVAKKAAEEEEKAKIAALASEKKAKEEEAKARQLAIAEAKAKEEAIEQRNLAKIAEAEAKRQRDRAEQQAYIALISAAAAKIDENAFDSARQLLQECAPAYRNWEWGRLWHVCNQSVGERNAGAEIAGIEFNPKLADQFATGSLDGKVRLWTLKDDRSDDMHVPMLDTGREEVFAVAYSPDGKYLAVGTGSQDGFLQIWDVETRTRIAQIAGGKRDEKLSPHTQDVVSVQFNASGDLLLTSSLDSTAKVWDVSDREHPKVRATLKGHTWWVWNARFSPDGQQILTVSDDGNAIVWTDRTGQWMHDVNIKSSPKFRGHTGPIFAGDFSPDGERIATAGYDQRVLVWRPGDLKDFDHDAALATFDPNRPRTTKVAVNSKVLEGHTGPIRSLRFWVDKEGKKDELFLITSGDDNTIRVWNTTQGGRSVVLRGHGKAVQACDISADDKWIVSGSLDGKARIWDLSRYEEQRVLRGDVLDGHEDAVLSAYFSDDGSKIVTASRDGTAKTWDPAKSIVKNTFEEGHTLQEGHLFRAARAIFFDDDKYLATSAVDNTVRIWDVSRGIQLEFLENTGRNAALAISADGSLMVTGSGSQDDNGGGFYAQVWTWNDKQQKVQPWNSSAENRNAAAPYKLGNHGKTVTQVAVSADKRFIATGDANGRCNLWELNPKSNRWEPRPLTGSEHINGITALSFLPDNSRLLSGDSNENVFQWDLSSFQRLGEFTIQLGSGITAMDTAQLPGGDIRALAVCTDDGLVEIHDVDRPRRSKIRSLVSKYRFGTPDDVSFSPDASRIMVVATPRDDSDREAARTAAVHLFESVSGKEIEFRVSEADKGPFLYLGRNGDISSATFNSDGTRIIAVGGNRAQLWKVDPDLALAKREEMRFRPHGPIATARFLPNAKTHEEDRYVITGSWDTTIKVWDTKTGKNKLTLKDLHTRAVNSIRVFESGDRNLVLSASDDGTAKLWHFDPENESVQLLTTFAHKAGVTSAIFIPRRNPITASYLVGLFFGEPLAPVYQPPRDLIATTSRDGNVRIWEVPKQKSETPLEKPLAILSTPEGDSTELLCVAASYDGRWIVAGGEKDVKIWDLDANSTEPDVTLSGHTASVTSIEFSGEADHSHRLLTGSEDFTAKVWDTSKLWETHEEPVEDLSEAKGPNKIEVTEIMTLKGHTRAVTSVTFSPDGRECLTASQDGTAIVWPTSWPDAEGAE